MLSYMSAKWFQLYNNTLYVEKGNLITAVFLDTFKSRTLQKIERDKQWVTQYFAIKGSKIYVVSEAGAINIMIWALLLRLNSS